MIYLGFDYGEKRIGVAVGDDLTGMARPLPAITTARWLAVKKMITAWKPEALVVGLPLNDDGGEQSITTAARAFADDLRQRSGLEVALCDERYSSRAADDVLREARGAGRMTRRVRKGDRDGEAARLILEQWFAERLSATRPAN